jgi:hypothetical protein
MSRVILVLLLLIAAVPVLQAQSLAESAASARTLRKEVARSGHASRLYRLVGRSGAAPIGPALSSVAMSVADSDPPPHPAHGAAYWHDRMQTLATRRATDQALLAAAVAHDFGFDQSPWDDAPTELTRRAAVVQADTRALHELELEAHRAGVPPGWLVWE